MRSMEIDRRRFLMLASVFGILPSTLMAASTEALYLAARKKLGRFEAVLFDEHGHDRVIVPMPDRGHSFAIDAARGRAVVFGRQPGFFAVSFDLAGKETPQALQAAPERHFFGHGVYSPDGKLMVSTENDYEAGRGVLGIYDAGATGGYRRIGEFPTAGIGPHEVVLMPDGRTLCVANGGILTHPDYGKLELNADTMRPSLAYVDLHTGDLLEQVFLAPQLHRLSIRHLVVDAAGSVWFGCQYTGATLDSPPLVGRHRRGAEPELFTGPADTLRSMKNYVGSLACDASGTLIAASSPLGGIIVFWDALTGKCLGSTEMFDGCGVAAFGNSFVASSGQGVLAQVQPGYAGKQTPISLADVAWDNHLRRI